MPDHTAELLEALEQQTAVIEMWIASAHGQSDVTDAQLANATNAAVEKGDAALAQARARKGGG